MYNKSNRSIEQICVCRIDEMIKPLAFPWPLPKAAEKAALKPGQREPIGQRAARLAYRLEELPQGVFI